MPDGFEKLVIAVVSAISSALLVWLGTYIADHRKRRNDRLESLRRAYSQWFASEAFVKMGFDALVTINNDPAVTEDRPQLLLVETQALVEKVGPLISSLNEIILLESSQECRKIVLDIHSQLEALLGGLKYLVSSHNNLHIRVGKLFGDININMADSTDEEVLRKYIQLTSDTLSLKEDIKHLQPGVMAQLIEIATSVHERSGKFRNALADRFAENNDSPVTDLSI